MSDRAGACAWLFPVLHFDFFVGEDNGVLLSISAFSHYMKRIFEGYIEMTIEWGAVSSVPFLGQNRFTSKGEAI
jgi:hypothetical protein